MRKFFLFLCSFIIITLSAKSQGATPIITDSPTLRAFINFKIVPNGQKEISANDMNRILNGLMNIMGHQLVAGNGTVPNTNRNGVDLGALTGDVTQLGNFHNWTIDSLNSYFLSSYKTRGSSSEFLQDSTLALAAYNHDSTSRTSLTFKPHMLQLFINSNTGVNPGDLVVMIDPTTGEVGFRQLGEPPLNVNDGNLTHFNVDNQSVDLGGTANEQTFLDFNNNNLIATGIDTMEFRDVSGNSFLTAYNSNKTFSFGDIGGAGNSTFFSMSDALKFISLSAKNGVIFSDPTNLSQQLFLQASQSIEKALAWPNTPHANDTVATLYDIRNSVTNQNFANTDLTFTGNRIHDLVNDNMTWNHIGKFTANLKGALSNFSIMDSANLGGIKMSFTSPFGGGRSDAAAISFLNKDGSTNFEFSYDSVGGGIEWNGVAGYQTRLDFSHGAGFRMFDEHLQYGFIAAAEPATITDLSNAQMLVVDQTTGTWSLAAISAGGGGGTLNDGSGTIFNFGNNSVDLGGTLTGSTIIDAATASFQMDNLGGFTLNMVGGETFILNDPTYGTSFGLYSTPNFSIGSTQTFHFTAVSSINSTQFFDLQADSTQMTLAWAGVGNADNISFSENGMTFQDNGGNYFYNTPPIPVSTDTTTFKILGINTSTNQMVEMFWDGAGSGGGGSNFANTDLTLTADRTHDGADFGMILSNFNTFSISANRFINLQATDTLILSATLTQVSANDLLELSSVNGISISSNINGFIAAQVGPSDLQLDSSGAYIIFNKSSAPNSNSSNIIAIYDQAYIRVSDSLAESSSIVATPLDISLIPNLQAGNIGDVWTNKGIVGTLAGTGHWAKVYYKGRLSTTGTATTTFTVTIGTTQPNGNYNVALTPLNSLSTSAYFVTNKTTTTFDVTFLSGVTGAVLMDWEVFN